MTLEEYTTQQEYEYYKELSEILREELLAYVSTLIGPPGRQGEPGIGLPGQDGKSPTEAELLAIIKPLIPDPVIGPPGLPGDRGPQGNTGKPGRRGEKPTIEELLRLIRPLIPQPLKGDKGDPGHDGKDIIEIDPELLWKRLQPFLIKYLNRIKPYKHGAGGGGGGTPETLTVSGTVNGTNTTFTFSKNYNFVVIYWNGQQQQPVTHYTFTSGSSTIVFTAGNIPTAGTIHGYGWPS